MEVAEVKIHEVNKDSLKAFASITLGGEFVVTGLSVREGKNGLFVSMPSRKAGNEYKDICYPITKELRQKITTAVLEKYNEDDFYP